ncbi:GIY-YIG nuclease family protein [Sphingorhabdus pulchriflava]|uniref:GIY-YIG nuclease family protein n=1 Tax=Sphingorhabdus pulchriflava TaxID=2292257 RepID=A0A371BFE3_9SPHN|nr:GIY-YIG nuclease family protein [Sphingorhabdus pulchriflava]RDV06218.1 GIY-YIG nuclease family protein [Sphingorhabdus pulchriflava]
MRGGHIYLMTNKPFGVLYIGVTADLSARVNAHKRGEGSVFCKRWGLDRLVWMEPHRDIDQAIKREKQLKRWKRAWKLRMIVEANPNWDDLYLGLNG